jgi:uncharacterized membrane protein YkvA (DUF1232 family)
MSRAVELYQQLCEDLTPAGLAALRVEVREHYDALVAAQQRLELIAIDLAEMLCDRLEKLLDAAPHLDGADRAAIVGAARYFVTDDDAVPDEKACTGLDDDVAVFNHVVRLLHRAELVITE